jgi:hypothetical protein
VARVRYLKICTFCKGQLISKQNCRDVTSPKNERTNLLKSKFKFQVIPSRQDRKTNSLVHFLGEVTKASTLAELIRKESDQVSVDYLEVTARKFCFEIY